MNQSMMFISGVPHSYGYSVFERTPDPDLDSGVEIGSREENASEQKLERGSDGISTEKL
jgi:hypothetical protein